MTQQNWGRPPAQGNPWPQQGWQGQPQWPQQPARPGLQQPGSVPGWPPPQPGQFPAPAVRRSNPLRTLFLALIGVCGALLLGIVVANLFLGATSTAGTGTTTGPTTSGTTTSGPRPTEENYTAPPPDMNPPELPAPTTYSEATTWLEKNAVYRQSTTVPNGCSFLTPIDASTAHVSELQTHIESLTACLVKVWQQPVTSAGFVLPRPPATVYTTPINTACGKLDRVNASYCGGDQRIYYSQQIPRIFPPALRGQKFLMDLVLAHEFGHAIQARTGISISEVAWEQKVGKPAANVFSRRLEQQADCLAGMFTTAVADSQQLGPDELARLKEIAFNLGDDVLSGEPNIDSGHGLGKNRQAWFTKGLSGGTSIGQCNTFIASPSQVR